MFLLVLERKESKFIFRKLFLVGLFFTISSILFAQSSINDTIKNLYDQSKFIFIGKVKGMNGSLATGATGSDKNSIVEFNVIEIYKGPRWQNVVIVSDKKFEINKEYLVYAKQEEKVNSKGKKIKSNYFIPLRFLFSDNDKALPDVKELVKILKTKLFGRIKSPRAKIILRKCNCSKERL